MYCKTVLSLFSALLIVFLPTNSFAATNSSNIANLVISSPTVSTLDNLPIAVVDNGQQVILSISVSNRDRDVEAEFIAIIEVRDKSGVTTYLQFQKSTIAPSSKTDIGISWTVDKIANHDIRAFLISNFANPSILSPITETKLLANGKGQLTVEQQPISPEIPVQDYDNEENHVTPSIAELKQIALKIINQDRKKYGLEPVALSDNVAAQAHADDLFKTRYHSSHWTSDGMKPYMRYSVYGGQGAVFQNVHAGQIYPDDILEGCETGKLLCGKVDMEKQLYDSEYSMMYDDAHSDWGHRDNILDKHHTHVSLGIAYDDYYFAYVQNFENLPIEFDQPVEENEGYVDMSGTINTDTLSRIAVYYDEPPTVDTYNKFRDQTFYDNGEFIAMVVEPAGSGYHYIQPSNYTIIEARRWETEGQSFHLEFDLDQLMNKKNGVYTISIILKDDNQDSYEGASQSFFER